MPKEIHGAGSDSTFLKRPMVETQQPDSSVSFVLHKVHRAVSP